MRHELQNAWNWRKEKGLFEPNGALRIFHGPTEGKQASSDFTVDRFGVHYWATYFGENPDPKEECSVLREFLNEQGARSAVIFHRPKKGVGEEPALLLGQMPEPFEIVEDGAHAQIRFSHTKHPGLFLDHRPLRQWLKQNSKGLRVLNTFAYTGNLSVASALGGASSVLTLDLSKPILEWAKINWDLNSLGAVEDDWIFGDAFEWMKKWVKKNRVFDQVIIDPPSFSHSKNGEFSVLRDLPELLTLGMNLVSENGFLIFSTNLAQLSEEKFFKILNQTLKAQKKSWKLIQKIKQPETFPIRSGDFESQYLKGCILQNS